MAASPSTPDEPFNSTALQDAIFNSEIQGYHFSRPLPLPELETFLQCGIGLPARVVEPADVVQPLSIVGAT